MPASTQGHKVSGGAVELGVLGLTEEMTLVYTALVGLPRCTALDLATSCGLSASGAGKLLSALVREGLAIRSAGRPPRFTAVAPEVAMTALIQRREHELDTARFLVQQLAEAHREANRISNPDIAVELLTDLDDISAAVRRLTSSAKRLVRAFDRPPYVDRPGSNLDDQLARQRNGITHKVIYDRQAVAWPARLRNDILPSMRSGEDARVRPELPLKMVISDSSMALIPFSLAPRGHSAAYLIHSSPILAALESLFDAEWERAVPIRDLQSQREVGPALSTDVRHSPTPPAPAAAAGTGTGTGTGTAEGALPDPETRVLLTLLSSGLSDMSIARSQGWSSRTTQRRIQRLMSELGAASRFQAALMAAHRGWI